MPHGVHLGAMPRSLVRPRSLPWCWRYTAAPAATLVALVAHRLIVDGDPTRLAQVVGNLLTNAVKFTPEVGSISLSLRTTDGLAVLAVSDTGIGIDPDTLPRLFEPFAQADRSLDRSRGGLGLGLALVKGMVELHGGEASAHSEGPGKGARFTITVPLAGRGEATRGASVVPPPGDSGARGAARDLTDAHPRGS